jgi:IclR family transcriptional regulator, acetate operon repressor
MTFGLGRTVASVEVRVKFGRPRRGWCAVDQRAIVFGVAVTGSDSTNDVALRSARYARYEVKSVARALDLLELLSDHADEGLSVTEAAAAMGASKSATFAMLQTLVGRGYASDLDRGRRYRLGSAVLRLSDSHTRSMTLIDLARPTMRALTEETGWASRLAIHDNGYPVFIDRVDGPGSIRFHMPLGLREAPHRSAAGKAILAGLDEGRVRAIAHETGLTRVTPRTITDVDTLLADLALVRIRGFAVDDEEDTSGVLCVGAAFQDRDGGPAGAVSITGLKADIPDWRLQELGRIVRAHADDMARAIGGQAWRPPLGDKETS